VPRAAAITHGYAPSPKGVGFNIGRSGTVERCRPRSSTANDGVAWCHRLQ